MTAPANAHIIQVYGPVYCETFWRLLASYRWAEDEERRQAKFAFDKHHDDCDDCKAWAAVPQPEPGPVGEEGQNGR